MKSIKLTNQIREDILKSVAGRWKENNPKPDLVQAEHDFAMYLWEGKYKKYKDVLDAVPKAFLNTDYDMKYCVNGEVGQVRLKEKMPVDWRGYRGAVLKSLNDSNKHYQKYDKVRDAYKKWCDLRNEVINETKAILESVNTTKQLLEVWPNCEKFLPAYVANADKSIRLPAVQISRLEERLGEIDESK